MAQSKFQTSDFVALDIWMLQCIVFVASALFEYAVLVTIRFGKQNKVNDSMIGLHDETEAVGRCRKIDRYALRVFIVLYTIVICCYISFVKLIPKTEFKYPYATSRGDL